MIFIDNLPLSQAQNNLTAFNTKTITLWITKQQFYLEPNYKKSLIPTILNIDRTSSHIKETSMQGFIVPSEFTPHYYSFFVGIITLKEKKVLLFAEEAQLVCSIRDRDIFKITKPILIFYDPKSKYEINEQQAKLLINIVIIFENGLYYSYSYDLTQPVHFFQSERKGDTGFNWAQKIQKQLKDYHHAWSLPVIQGFVGKMEVFLHGTKIHIILISRRSIFKGGPYHATVGIDSLGYVANYVETEQLILLNDYIFSFIQIRGSVPVFWSHIFSYGVLKQVRCMKTIEQNTAAFRKHVRNIKKDLGYQKMILLNLLSSNSPSIESKLVQNFEYLISKCQDQAGLYYAYFDLHNECSQKKYQTLGKFITNKLAIPLKSCQFTALKQKNDHEFQILNSQSGVFRSNCLYCIDRTNIAQSKIAAFIFIQILSHFNIRIPNFSQDLKFCENDEPFGLLYRNLWADNGDQLSKQYTGTGSTQSYANRRGELSYMTSIDHGMTSITRALRNIRQQDDDKNTAIEFLIENIEINLPFNVNQWIKNPQKVQEGL